MNKVELGDRVKDVVTGFSGIAAGITKFLTGCDQVLIDPGVGEDGKLIESHCFDIMRVEVVEEGVVDFNDQEEEKKGAGYDISKIKKRH